MYQQKAHMKGDFKKSTQDSLIREEKMINNQFLHHYTTIEALSLILKNHTIRFNRLDHVDDVLESDKFGGFNLSRYIFVSCWTNSNEENIPLWHMYSKGMTGIRISLPIDPFDYNPLKPHPLVGGEIEGQILSFLPLEELFTQEYIVNSVCMFNKQTFIKQVEYVDEESLKKIRRQAIKIEIDKDGKEWTTVDGPTQLAGYKSKNWEFQTEVRYIIMIYPSPPISQWTAPDSHWVENFPKFFIKSIQNDTGPNKEYFDINLSQSALDNIQITLAPLASEYDEIILDALLKRYTKNGKFTKSSLSQSIRRPLK